MRFGILGPVTADDDGRTLPVGGTRARTALAALLVSANEVVSAEALATVLWPGRPLAEARNAVQTQLSRLRRVVGSERLETVGPGYRLRLDPAELDALSFSEAAARAEAALAAGCFAIADADATAALAAWRGPALVELADQDFARGRAAELEERRLATIECRAEARLALGRSAEVVRDLRALADAHPYRERLWGQLMVALYREGRQAEALRIFSTLRTTLAEELGIPPSPELVALEAAIVRQELPTAPAAAPPTALGLPPGLGAPGGRPFVGRRRELERLDALWGRAARGERPVALVAGEPGIGKTRLAAEVARRAVAGGAVSLYGRCDEELATPFRPVVEALQPLTRDATADVLRRWAGVRAPELVRLLPERGDLGAPTTADPRTERLLLFEGVDRLLAGASRDRPLLVVLDDLHWADRSTLALVRYLTRSPEDGALALVATYRDTDVTDDHPLTALLADLRRGPDVHRMALAGLSPEETTELVGQRELGVDPSWVHERTDGNPFFVGELLAHLADGAPSAPRDRGALASRIDVPVVPEGIREVVARRLSRLSDEANRALAVAAVVGRDFDLHVVERVQAAGAGDGVLGALDEAVAARLVTELPSTGRYTFVHTLVQETVLARLNSTHRARLHRRVGDALEALPDAAPSLIAHHFCAGAGAGGAERAVHWSLVALEVAIDDLAWEQAQVIAERALSIAEQHQGATAEPARARARLRRALATTLAHQGNVGASKEQDLLAAEAARDAGDHGLFVEAAIGRVSWVLMATPDPEGEALLVEALRVLRGDDLVLRARVEAQLAMYRRVSECAGAEAEALARHALASARRSGDAATTRIALEALSFVLLAGPDTLTQRSVCEELLGRTGASAGPSVDYREVALRQSLVLSLQMGDRDGTENALAAYRRDLSASLPANALIPMWTATLALMDGDLEAAEQNNALLLRRGGTDVNFATSWAIQFAALRWEQGRVGEVVPLLRSIENSAPHPTLVRALAASSLAELGERREARFVLRQLTADGLAAVPRDMFWSAALASLANACGRLEDHDTACALHEALLAFSGQLLQVAWSVVCPGAADRYLAMLEVLLDRHADAERHFHTAVELEEGARAPALAARTRLWWGRSLLDHHDHGQAEGEARELLTAAAAFGRQRGLVAIAEEAGGIVGR